MAWAATRVPSAACSTDRPPAPLPVEPFDCHVADFFAVVLAALADQPRGVDAVVVHELDAVSLAGFLYPSHAKLRVKDFDRFVLLRDLQVTLVFVNARLVVLPQVGEFARVGRVAWIFPINVTGNFAAHEVVADAAGRLERAARQRHGGAVHAQPRLADALARVLGHGAVLAAVDFDEEDRHTDAVNDLAGYNFARVDVSRGAGGPLEFILDEFDDFPLTTF